MDNLKLRKLVWWRRKIFKLVGLFIVVAGIAGGVSATVIANQPREEVSINSEDDSTSLENMSTSSEIMSTSLENMSEPNGRTIYLTFDDGPSEHTGRLLDMLKKYNVKATFFVTCGGDDALIQREHGEGHAVALHTCSHNYANVYASVVNYFNDLAAVQDRVARITGETATLIRFPGGSSNTVSRRYVQGLMSTLVAEVTKRGYTYFDWNVASGDTDGLKTADAVYERTVTTLRQDKDSVVLQHDTKGYSVDAVERIIVYGLTNGYVFDKLSATSETAHHAINN